MTPDGPHRRFNPLTGRHVLVSPQRAARPWRGALERVEAIALPDHVADCALCPGNVRADGARNPATTTPFAFDNDFAALGGAAGDARGCDDPLARWAPATGMARVLVTAAAHGASVAAMDDAAVAAMIDLWCDEVAGAGARHPHVQLFENRGAMMGASSPHPHAQLWASDHAPDEWALEDKRQRAWHDRSGTALLAAVRERELRERERIVLSDGHWVALVPFWAVWPFELLLLPTARVARLPDLTAEARGALGAMMRAIVRMYDALFACAFPYSMGWHGAAFDERAAPHWLLHAHFFPPLLRSASVRKHMVGYEMLAEAQRDLTPERAAAMLRATR